MKFTELGIDGPIEEMLNYMGITSPTPIQEQAIPEILAGRDVIGKAQTGTGKTLAFLLPIIEHTDTETPYIQSLIVTPTRELALQITAELTKFAEQIEDFHVLAVYGGQDVDRQLKKLKRSILVVVATPGRLLDHTRRGTIDLSKVKHLVLDEADQMLQIGFLPEVEEIIENIPADRQTLLFSATMPEQVISLSKRFMNNPLKIAVENSQVTVKQIRQVVIETTDRAKQESLIKIIEEEQPYLAIIFCRTKRRVSVLNEALKTAGFNSDELHGDISQAKRERVMRNFRNASLQFLVATDVAARGLDVEGVTHVFNYDVPEDAENYIHRIGRTGRAGEHGLAVTFIATKDLAILKDIEKGIEMQIDRRRLEGIVMNEPTRATAKPKRVQGNNARSDFNKRHAKPSSPSKGTGKDGSPSASRKRGPKSESSFSSKSGNGRSDSRKR